MKVNEYNAIAYRNMQEKFKVSDTAAVIQDSGNMAMILKWLIAKPKKSFLFLAPNSTIMKRLQKSIELNGYKMTDFPNLKCALYEQLLNWDNSDFNFHYDNIIFTLFHHAGDLRWSKAIQKLLSSNPNSKLLGISSISPSDLDNKNMIDILFEENVVFEKGGAIVEKTLPKKYKFTKKIKSNIKKLTIIESYLSKGKNYEDIVWDTKDEYGNAIGQWIYAWRSGRIKLNEEERDILMSMGETFQPKIKPEKSNMEKLTIIESYLGKGKNYEDIVRSTKDEYGNAIGQWIDAWRSGSIKLNEEERDILMSMGETFQPKIKPKKSNIEKLTIIENYLSKGNNYEDIVQSTKDEYGNAIGQWMSFWRCGHVKLNGEERDILMSLGETFEPKRRLAIYSIKKNYALEKDDIKSSKAKKCKNNQEKLTILQAYLNKGHAYEEIVRSTKDVEGNPIGAWISTWRCGQIALTEEERMVLMSLGETFERKLNAKISNYDKLLILQLYLREGHAYEEIVQKTKDEEGNPLGRWIEKWRSGQIALTKEERIVLMSLGETFEPKRRLAVYSIKDNCTLEKGGIKSSKVKKDKFLTR